MGSCPQVPQPGEVQIRAVEPVGGRHSVPERIRWPLVELGYSGLQCPKVTWSLLERGLTAAIDPSIGFSPRFNLFSLNQRLQSKSGGKSWP